jgi:hypothetical protein
VTTPKDENPKAMTAAEAAKQVKRPVTELVDGKPKTRQVAVKADEVLSFKDYGSFVVVVTKDGQKFSSADVGAAE